MPMTTGNREATQPYPMPTQATKPLGLDDLQAAVQLGLIDHETLAKVLRKKQKDDIVRNHRHAISQLRDGRWQTYYIHPKTKKRKDLRAKSREALIEKLFATVQEVENAAKPSPDELFEEWLSYKEAQTNSENSIIRFRQRYNRYLRGTELFHTPVKSIDKLTLEIFCNQLVKDYDMTSKEYSNTRTIIMGLFNYALDKNILTTNPMERITISVKFRQPKLKTGETETYTDEEEEEIQKYLEEHFEATKDPGYIAIVLNFYLGLRIGELSSLKWSDIADKNHIHIQREEVRDHINHRYKIVEHTKGYHERYVHLVPKAISIIDELKTVTRDPTGDRWMFVRQKKRITSRQITYILEKYSKDTGHPVKRSHKIRKTYGSTLHKKGVPLVIIKDELGHSDIRTTEQHYIYNQASDKETYNILKNAF